MYDIIVIGSGHNGLTTACRLSKNGKKVLVLEKQAETGGLAAKREFAPGFSTNGTLQDTSMVRKESLDGLNLNLKWNDQSPEFFTPTENAALLFRQDSTNTLSEKDAKSYKRYRAFLSRIKKPIEMFLETVPAHFDEMSWGEKLGLLRTGMSVRMLGKRDMMEVLRVPPMCVADWVGEWFEDDTLKASLCLSAISCTQNGPWSPGTALNLLFKEVLRENDLADGPAGLIEALAEGLKATGGELRTSNPVAEILFQGNKATGVRLESGEEIQGKKIVSAADPKNTFYNLVPTNLISLKMEDRLHTYRAKGCTAVVNIALDQALEFNCGTPWTHARIVSTVDNLEKAYDAIKYGKCSTDPALELYRHGNVVQALVHYCPYTDDEQKNDELRSEVEQTFKAKLSPMTKPHTARAMEVLTPRDIEKKFGLAGGHLNHGEHAIDQILVRPFPECSRYETPFENLFLCGSGTFPGGNLTCLPGHLASQII